MKQEKITVEALQYYVPTFQKADKAMQILMNKDNLTAGEKNQLETLIILRTMTRNRIAELCGPLITKELNRIISTSTLKNNDLFNILYAAGIDGMCRGLRKFDTDKIDVSSTNYLFQWIVAYAKKELDAIEAPYGIPVSRFAKYKKISAIRKKLTEEHGRYATNEEVHEFLQSGKADLKTMIGKKTTTKKPSQANKNITIELIKEQEEFEQKMMNTLSLDPTIDYGLSHTDKIRPDTFDQTLFGLFCKEHQVNQKARLVLMSEVDAQFTNEEKQELKNIPQRQYANYVSQWKKIMKAKNGPLYNFLLQKQNTQEIFDEIDINHTIQNIEKNGEDTNPKEFERIFKK